MVNRAILGPLPDPATAVAISGFSFGYQGRAGLALQDISLRVGAGEFVFLIGPSGCGKSTLCDALTGIIPHQVSGRARGSVRVFGVDTWDYSVPELSTLVGLVKQNPEDQLVTFTVHDEIAFGLENLGLPDAEIRARVREVAKAFYLAPLLDREIQQLSGGEKQRVVVASIMAMRPRLLVLDEPSAFLDYQGLEHLLDVIHLLKAAGDEPLTIVLVDHRLDYFLPFSTRVIFMTPDGRIQRDLASTEFLALPPGRVETLGIRLPLWLETFFAHHHELARHVDPTWSLSRVLGQIHADPRWADFLAAAVHQRARALNPTPRVPPPGTTPAGDPRAPLFEVDAVSFDYPAPTGPVPALRDVSLTIRAGETLAITGPNGSGKSTLLHLLAGFEQPGHGTVKFHGKPLADYAPAEFYSQLGFIFQNPDNQIFKATVEAEILYAVHNFGVPRADWAAEFGRLKALFKFTDFQHNPFRLSWGQKRRVNVASILVYQPPIIFLDEPFIGQDSKNVRKIMSALFEQAHPDRSLLIVSHDEQLLFNYADRVVHLEDGRIVARGPPEEILTRYFPRGFAPDQRQLEGKA